MADLPLAAFDAAMAAANPALAIEALVTAVQGGAGLAQADLAGAYVRLADLLAEGPAALADLVGFDRPATLHVVTPTDAPVQTRAALLMVLRARPSDRHVVLFTGPEADREVEAQLTGLGAFVLRCDPALGLADRWSWLAGRLRVLVAQRVLIHADPGDVLAGLAARLLAPDYGARLYLLHHAAGYPGSPDGLVPDLIAPGLARATHLVASAAQKPVLRAAMRMAGAGSVRLGLLPFGFDPALTPVISMAAPLPAIAPLQLGQGRKVLLRSGLRNLRDRLRRRKAIMQDTITRAVGTSAMITATSADLSAMTPAAASDFAARLVALLAAGSARHLHFGPVAAPVVPAVRAALLAAGLEETRVIFTGRERSVVNALRWHRVSLFLASLPGITTQGLAEAASAGVPIALHADALPPAPTASLRALIWDTPTGLFADAQADLTNAKTRAALSDAAQGWHRRHASPRAFDRRLGRILDVTEGALHRRIPEATLRSATASLFDAAWYLRQNPDVGAARHDPLDHYLAWGEAEGRAPHPLFHPRHYAANLPEAVRPKTGLLAHYVLYGEGRGHVAHPLFVPAYCARFLPPVDNPSAANAPGDLPGDLAADAAATTVLARYIAQGGASAAPHPLFDPVHYAKALALPPDQPLLLHFLDSGATEGLSPHPLIEADCLKAWGADPRAALLWWLARPAAGADEPRPALLFDPVWFCGSDGARYACAAPNLLWAHLIEGNRADRGPHPLVDAAHVARRRPDVLARNPRPVLMDMVQGRLDGIDTHPLVSVAHILAQAPWVGQSGQHPTRYFTERALAENLNPHPWFSTQVYLLNGPDVAAAGLNPLLHYLSHGQYEGRVPHLFFDGNDYYNRYLRAHGGGSPLLDYAARGAGRFLPVQPHDQAQARLALKTARALFSTGAAPDEAVAILRGALHPDWAAPHASLCVETRPLARPDAAPPLRLVHAAADVALSRPAVMAGAYLAPPAVRYTAPEVQAGLWPRATVIGGTDGFVTSAGDWWAEGPEAAALPGSAEAADADLALRDATALVARRDGAVLLRHHGAGPGLARAILACGSRSADFAHFLLEVLPRALIAAEGTPADTPVLTEDDLHPQAYQALRLALPGHPVLRLARGASVTVAQLYVAGMANVLATPQVSRDPAAQPGPAALSLHPALLARLNRLARGLGEPTVTGQRLFLLPADPKVRKLLNAAELSAVLAGFGFAVLHPETLPLADLIRQIAQADTIVAADGPHLAALVFARPGTQAFVLLSNAPGTDFHRADVLGRLSGLSVTTLAGWQLQGSAGAHLPLRDAHFTLPAAYMTAFFDTVSADMPRLLSDILSSLHGLSFGADVLSGSWAVLASGTPGGFGDRLCGLRRGAVVGVLAAAGSSLEGVLGHGFFADYGRSLRSGFAAFADLEPDLRALGNRVAARLSGLGGDPGAGFAGAGSVSGADLAGIEPVLGGTGDVADGAALANPALDGIALDAASDGVLAGPALASLALNGAFAGAERLLGEGPLSDEDLRRLLLLGMLLVPNWRVGLPRDPGALPGDVLDRWLHWATVPPFLHRAGEDAAWVGHVARLLDWVADRLDMFDSAGIVTDGAAPAASRVAGGLAEAAGATAAPLTPVPRVDAALRGRLLRLVTGLDLGQLLLVDVPLGAVQAARNRVLEHVALRSGRPRQALRPALPRPLDAGVMALRAGGISAATEPVSRPAPGSRRRIGLLCRTFEKGPDSEAVVAFFQAFDPARYEIYAYSIGFRDRVVSRDPGFDARFDAAIAQRRDLPGDPAGVRAQLLADDLDVFLYANATTYGIQPLDIALYHRVAPLQVVLNSHLPMAMGYPSFDAVLTGLSDDPAQEVDQAQHRERLVRVPGPVISYLTTLQPRKTPALDRAALGLRATDVVMMNAGSLLKLRHQCLLTMMQAVAAVPDGVLLLAPYNPGWAARSLAFAFNAQLAETAAAAGLAPERIVVLGELSVAEAEAALACADIYLNPFPHGGATMTHLALIYGVPPVTLRRSSTRSIDQFLVGALGFDELLASSPAEYAALAVALGRDAPHRTALAARLRDAARHPVFVDSPEHSRAMQAALEQLMAQAEG